MRPTRIAIDLDSRDDFKDFAKRFRLFYGLLPTVEEVIVEESEKGYHILFLTHPHDVRRNLAIRLLLGDDLKHVLYDLRVITEDSEFPTNVLFTEKRYASRSYREIFRGSLPQFRRWLVERSRNE